MLQLTHLLNIILVFCSSADSSTYYSGGGGWGTLNCFPPTVLALQRCRSVSLPNHWILQAHCSSTALLLRLVPVYVPHAHPASPRPSPRRFGADRPLGVVLGVLEGVGLARADERDVQNLPAQRAVGGEDARGANPELNQEV